MRTNACLDHKDFEGPGHWALIVGASLGTTFEFYGLFQFSALAPVIAQEFFAGVRTERTVRGHRGSSAKKNFGPTSVQFKRVIA